MNNENSISEGKTLLRNEGNATTSTVAKTGVNQIDSLLSGVKWGDNNVTFSFPTSSLQYTGYSSGDEPSKLFRGLNSLQQDAARSALAIWASVCNLNFIETTGGNGEIRFGTSSQPETSWAYYPSSSDKGGDVWFGNMGSNAPTNPIVGSYAYATYIHEIGHALGLKHPHDSKGSGVVASSNFDSIEYSIMSYRSYVSAGVDGYTIQNGSYPTSLMMSDIAAIQNMYGANYNYNAGNTVYKFDPNQSTIFETIWDGGGNDTYDLSAYTTNLKIDLRPGEWSTFDTNQLAYLGDGHYARGNVANALLYNGDIRSLIDNAIGGSGNDILIGNQADNYLVGGAGNDIIDGLSGFNTAGYYGDLANFFVVHDAQGHALVSDCTGAEGNDLLANISQIRFSDSTVSSSYEQFDGLRYIASYVGLIDVFRTDQNAAKTHFINSGFSEGRRASFDALAYTASYGGLIDAFGTDKTAAELHYINSGYKEGRTVTFDALAYTASYGGLIDAFGTDKTAAELHYISYGYKEGRTVTFDALAYTASYGGLIDAFGTDKTAAELHYISYGYKEGRTSTFNAVQYLANFSGLQAIFGNDLVAATKHYIQYGYKEGRTDKAPTGGQNLILSIGNVQAKDNVVDTILSVNNDSLFDNAGIDIVNDSAQNAYLYTSNENNYFAFHSFSDETIASDNVQDIVQLGSGFTIDNLAILQNSNDLVLNASKSDILTVAGEVTNVSSFSHLQFTDGTNYKVQNGHFAQI